jgi:hypothetical protein
MKHLAIKEGFVYDYIKNGVIIVHFVCSADNFTDFLTKAVPAPKLKIDKAKLNLFICD